MLKTTVDLYLLDRETALRFFEIFGAEADPQLTAPDDAPERDGTDLRR